MEERFELRIREKRKERGISQTELANAVGVTQGAVTQWESGNAFPKVITLRKIAEALGCAIDDLIIKDEAAAAGSDVEPSRVVRAG